MGLLDFSPIKIGFKAGQKVGQKLGLKPAEITIEKTPKPAKGLMAFAPLAMMGQSNVKALVLPKAVQLALKAFPFVDIVAKGTLVGLAGAGGYAAGSVLEKTPLATDPDMTYGQFYQELMAKGLTKILSEDLLTDKTKKALQEIVQSETGYKPTPFPGIAPEKARIEGFPEVRPEVEPEKILPREHILGKDIWRTPEGLTTVPPMEALPTEEEIKGKRVGIGEELIPPEVTETKLLKAKEPIPTPSDIPKDIEESVLQIIRKDGTDEFKVIPKGQLEEFQKLVDDSVTGVGHTTTEAGKFMLSAATPEKMIKGGVQYTGVAKPEDIPTKAPILTPTEALKVPPQALEVAKTPIVKGVSKGKVKPLIHIVTGKTKISNLIEIPEHIALKEQIKAEARAAKEGAVAGRRARMEVERAQKERREASARVNTMLKDIKEADVKYMRPSFAAKVKEIQEVLDFTVPTKKTLSKLWSRKEYLEEYPEANLPEYALDELTRLEKMNRSELTIEHLENLHMTVLNAVKLSELKNKLIGRQKGRTIEDNVIKSVNNIKKHQKIKPNEKYDIDFSQKNAASPSIRQVYTLGHWDPETVCNILDDNAEGDVISTILYEDIDKGVTEAYRYKQGAWKKQSDWFAETKININNWSLFFEKDKNKIDWQDIKLPSGKTIRMTKGNRIEFYMDTLNAKNNAHLESGFALKQDPTKIYKLLQVDIQAIVNSITDEEKRVASEVMKDIVWEPQQAAVNKPYVEINGYNMGKEENYIPIRIPGVALAREERGLYKRLSQMALEESGFTKARTNAKNPIIVGDIFETALQSINSAATFIGLAVPIRNARIILMDGRFESALTQTFGAHWHKNLERYLEDVVGGTANLDDIEKMVATAKDRLVGAKILANPFVWLYQPVSYMAASTEIDSKWLIKNVATVATKELIEKWTSRSPQIFERIRVGFSRDVADIGRIGEVRKFWTGRTGFITKLGKGISNFDTRTIIRLCEAAEDEQEALGYTGEELVNRATERAEKLIRRTQPTFHPKDRNAFSRTRNPLLKFITVFMSQRFKNANIQRRAFIRYGASPKGPRDKAKLIWALLVTSIVQHQLVRGLKRLRRKILRKPPPKKKDKPMTIFVREVLGGILGNFAGGATFIQSLASKIQNGTFAGYDMESVLANTLETGVDSIAETTRGVEQFLREDRFKSGKKKHELKWKTSIIRATDKAAQVILELKYGFPYMPVKEAIMGTGRWFVDPKTEEVKMRTERPTRPLRERRSTRSKRLLKYAPR